jgi:hypothetical protein
MTYITTQIWGKDFPGIIDFVAPGKSSFFRSSGSLNETQWRCSDFCNFALPQGASAIENRPALPCTFRNSSRSFPPGSTSSRFNPFRSIRYDSNLLPHIGVLVRGARPSAPRRPRLHYAFNCRFFAGRLDFAALNFSMRLFNAVSTGVKSELPQTRRYV